MCTTSFRHSAPADRRSERIGFRLVRPIEPDLDPSTSGVWVLQKPE